MSIQMPNAPKNTSGATDAEVIREDNAPRGGAQAAAPGRSFSPFGSISGGARLVGQVVPESGGSEKFNKLLENMQLVVKESPDQTKGIVVVSIPKEVTRLHYSAIAVVRTNSIPVANGAAKHDYYVAQILLVEATGTPPTSRLDESNRQRPVQVTLTSDDVYNGRFQTAARKIIGEHCGFPGDVFLIEAAVLRRDQDVTDTGNIRRLFSAMSTAVNTRAMSRHPDFSDWNMAHWTANERNEELPVTVESVSDETLTTATGDIVHADLSVSVHIETRRNNDRAQSEFDGRIGSELLSQVLVSMELVPVDASLLDNNEPSSNRRRRRGKDFEAIAAWMPRANIVHIEQMLSRTTGGILEAIASVSELNNRRQWASVYRPRMGSTRNKEGQTNIYDIGALNLHANLDDEEGDFGAPVIVEGDVEYGVFLDRTVTSQMAIGLDCTETGLQSYYTAAFMAVAQGDRDSRARATEEILSRARTLTNGAFDEYFDPRAHSILDGEGQPFVTGFWYDSDRQKRDIRQMASFLPMAAMVASQNANMKLLDDWMETVLGRADEHVRMAEQIKLLNAITDETLTVTGTGVRLTPSGDFVSALVRGINATGAPLVSRNGDVSGVAQQRRIVANYGQSALISTAGFGRAPDIRRGYNSNARRRSF